MIILIAGDTHTGKTWLAQRLLEEYRYSYFSIDHLKMGLIRSGLCRLHGYKYVLIDTSYHIPPLDELVGGLPPTPKGEL